MYAHQITRPRKIYKDAKGLILIKDPLAYGHLDS
jgi:hypothetical protein